jgi:aspartate/methionine/tyrosine aminotransferase
LVDIRQGIDVPTARLQLSSRTKSVIGFAAGEPDFPTPEHIVAAARAACGEPRMQKYGPTAGLPEQRAGIAAKTLRDSGLAVEPDQVIVTNGAKQAVFSALAAVLDDGDDVLLPAPYWTAYEEAARWVGAPGYARLSYARDDEALSEGMARMADVIGKGLDGS